MGNLFDPGALTVIFLFGSPLIAVVAYYVHLTLKVRSENELKRSLVEQGLSVEEIERIVAAGKDKDDDKE